MRRAVEARAAGNWPREEGRGEITLAFDQRHRRRIRLRCDDGAGLLLDLSEATALRDGDGLHCEDGSWVAVRAAPGPHTSETSYSSSRKKLRTGPSVRGCTPLY